MAEHILYTRKSVFSKPAAPAQAPRPDAVRPVFRLKDPGSAVTHFIGLVLAVLATPPLLIHAAGRGAGVLQLASLSVFMLSMAALYAASTAYHSFNLANGRNRILKKLDHMMIFVLIAGTYTPILLVSVRPLYPVLAWVIFGIQWGLTALAVALNAVDLKRFRVISMILYIAMGWCIIVAIRPMLVCCGWTAFGWILGGGISYTIGAILYGLGRTHRYCHSIFHIFVNLGSLLQAVAILFYIL